MDGNAVELSPFGKCSWGNIVFSPFSWYNNHEGSGEDAIRLLSKVFSTEKSAEEKKAVLSEEFHIEVTEEISREVSQVCNLSTGIYDKGLQEGIQKGKHEGIQEGRREGALEVLFGLVKDNLLSIADAAKRANIESSVFEKEYMAYMK